MGRHIKAMETNETLLSRSLSLIPGGVHSPVRSFKGLNEKPVFMEGGKGAYIYDVEGRDYIDFCMSFGPLILGHGDPAVKEALEEQLTRGWSYGTCEPYSLKLTDFLLSRLPLEQIRFVNSGTEAVMTALRLARAYTRRDKIIKFSGCYHGHTDAMLIKAGSGLAGTTEASSAGVPPAVAADTLIFELGDLEDVRKTFARYSGQIAAVIIEPLPANNGLLPQEREFLQELRSISQENGTLLIFDEVISGFRIGFGGIMEDLQIAPDIVTYGKIIGGGLPVGAVASSAEIMEQMAPIGDVYQAGTLSAGPLAMVAGLATLEQLTPEAYSKLEKQSGQIARTFKHWLANYQGGIFSSFEVISKHSLFWITSKRANFKDLFSTLLSKGIYLAPSAYEVGFVSLAHDERVIGELEKRLWGGQIN